jgi:hypothetical protein
MYKTTKDMFYVCLYIFNEEKWNIRCELFERQFHLPSLLEIGGGGSLPFSFPLYLFNVPTLTEKADSQFYTTHTSCPASIVPKVMERL